MSDIKDKKVVMHNIDGEEVDFSNLNIQEKLTYESANFIRRLVAFFFDTLIVVVIWYLCSITTFKQIDEFVANLGINPDDFTNPEVLKEFARLYHQTIVKLYMFFIFAKLAYYTLVPAIIGDGKTLGKLVCGIGVVNVKTLNEVTPTRLILREFVGSILVETIFIIPLLISGIIAMVREDSRSLHDLIAGTVVIKTDLYNVE